MLRTASWLGEDRRPDVWSLLCRVSLNQFRSVTELQKLPVCVNVGPGLVSLFETRDHGTFQIASGTVWFSVDQNQQRLDPSEDADADRLCLCVSVTLTARRSMRTRFWRLRRQKQLDAQQSPEDGRYIRGADHFRVN